MLTAGSQSLTPSWLGVPCGMGSSSWVNRGCGGGCPRISGMGWVLGGCRGTGIPWGETSAPLRGVLEMLCPLFGCPCSTEGFQHEPALKADKPSLPGLVAETFCPCKRSTTPSCSHSTTTLRDPGFGTGVCCGGSWDHSHTESSCQFEEKLVARVACPHCHLHQDLDSCREDPQLLQTHGCNRLQPLPNSLKKYSGICLPGFKWVNYLNFSTPR